MAKIIKMKDLLERKLSEGKADQSFKKIIGLLRKESRRLNDDDSYELSVKLKKWFNKNVYEGIREDFAKANQLKGFSSKEAKKVVDDGLRVWAKDLRKVEYRVVKDWMSKAKAGVIDYFDVVRGLETGDISRAHPEETKFFKAVLDRDKIMNRFRSYFKGKKGKKR